jgi:hypothetical protein
MLDPDRISGSYVMNKDPQLWFQLTLLLEQGHLQMTGILLISTF